MALGDAERIVCAFLLFCSNQKTFFSIIRTFNIYLNTLVHSSLHLPLYTTGEVGSITEILKKSNNYLIFSWFGPLNGDADRIRSANYETDLKLLIFFLFGPRLFSRSEHSVRK